MNKKPLLSPPSTEPKNFFSPLGLWNCESDLRPHLGLGVVPFCNALLLGIGLVLMNSQYLSPPGLSIRLPQMSSDGWEDSAVDAILTIADGQKCLFNRRLYDFSDLDQLFVPGDIDGGTLLLKVHAATPIHCLATVVDVAKMAGFKWVRLAVETP